MLDHWPGVNGSTDDKFVPSDVNFQITFSKPVVPVSVGQSIVFNKAPFNGNLTPLPNPESTRWPRNPSCTPGVPGFVQPICPDVSLRAYFLDETGNPRLVQTPIPCRIYPLHQNNLATDIVNPLIDIPGSSNDWSGDLPGEPPLPASGNIRMRIEATVHDFMLNMVTAIPAGNTTPQNLCVAGFHGERFSLPSSFTKTYSVLKTKRYLNPPVSPNVIYYTIGSRGIGAIDLDGNGFTTNAPGSGRKMLITSTTFYNPNGSCLHGTGNPYTYPVGVEHETPIPGVNEGSSGWWNDLDSTHSAGAPGSITPIYPTTEQWEPIRLIICRSATNTRSGSSAALTCRVTCPICSLSPMQRNAQSMCSISIPASQRRSPIYRRRPNGSSHSSRTD